MFASASHRCNNAAKSQQRTAYVLAGGCVMEAGFSWGGSTPRISLLWTCGLGKAYSPEKMETFKAA